jgi:hypothetical protein
MELVRQLEGICASGEPRRRAAARRAESPQIVPALTRSRVRQRDAIPPRICSDDSGNLVGEWARARARAAASDLGADHEVVTILTELDNVNVDGQPDLRSQRRAHIELCHSVHKGIDEELQKLSAAAQTAAPRQIPVQRAPPPAAAAAAAAVLRPSPQPAAQQLTHGAASDLDSKCDHLLQMQLGDAALNRWLLTVNGGDVERVAQWLLERQL